MHVTSNPYFAFHDDVFPAFVKNAVFQLNFPRSASSFIRPFPKTIIPDGSFRSLEEFKHISTFALNFNETGSLQFDLKVSQVYANCDEKKFLQSNTDYKAERIVECQFYNGKSLFTLGSFSNGSYWFDSDFSEDRLVFEKRPDVFSKIKLELTSKTAKIMKVKVKWNSENFSQGLLFILIRNLLRMTVEKLVP